ncbi:unnamed protein product [Phytophthora fragariaefolia]|uniref:Unnamed protein product n=1 Tax=Phytophthora fragariaefolia TaxID=1490495 RepID=A0A9W6YH52_9STRA|nr:unnamed protein product [Phytophthora fragariaefolia]
MEQPATPQNLDEMLNFLAQQQAQLQDQVNKQLAVQSARLETLITKPRATPKGEPPQFKGTLHEDLELWFFTIEQYYSDYHPLMVENSPTFVTMVSCHLRRHQ